MHRHRVTTNIDMLSPKPQFSTFLQEKHFMNLNEHYYYNYLKAFQKVAKAYFGPNYSMVMDGNRYKLDSKFHKLFQGTSNIIREYSKEELKDLYDGYDAACKVQDWKLSQIKAWNPVEPKFFKEYPLEKFNDIDPVDDYRLCVRRQFGIDYLAFFHENELIAGTYFKFIATSRGNLHRLLLKTIKSQEKKELVEPILSDEDYKNTIGAVKRFLRNRKQIAKLGITANKGLLMWGQPGNGKTLVSSYIKDYCKSKGLQVSVLNQGKLARGDMTGDVLIFDDFSIENLVKRTDITDLLLTELDGPNKQHGRIFIFTTNELDDTNKLYNALVRPGRIDTLVKLSKPTKELIRKYIDSWKVTLSEKQKAEIVEYGKSCSFAQLNYIQTEIAMRQIEQKEINIKDVFNICNIKLAENTEAKRKIGFTDLISDKQSWDDNF